MSDHRGGTPDPASVAASLLGQTAQIPWRELQRFFAAGRVLVVADSLDLVEVASSIASDDRAAVESLLDEADLRKVDDDRARLWIETDATLWCVVVRPWVLVQERRLQTDQGAGSPEP